MTRAYHAETKLVRIQEKGQVTLPAEARRRLGLKRGDLATMTKTADGLPITPQEVIATRALDRIGELLREKGITLAQMIESGREERTRLLEERDGIPVTQQGHEDLRRFPRAGRGSTVPERLSAGADCPGPARPAHPPAVHLGAVGDGAQPAEKTT